MSRFYSSHCKWPYCWSQVIKGTKWKTIIVSISLYLFWCCSWNSFCCHFFFCLYLFSMAGLVYFVLMVLFMYILLWFSLYISFDMSFFLFLFLFVILNFFLNLYHSIISPSVLRYVIHFNPVISLSVVHYILSFSPISFNFFFYVSVCYSSFPFYVHYSIYFFIFLCIFLIPFIFDLASKRNNYTDSEINTIVFHLVPLITRDQQWCACSAYPVFSVASSANSASSCYAIAICSEPKFTKNVKSYRYRCVCKK